MKFFSKKKKILILGLIGILLILFLNIYQKELKNFFYLLSSPIQKVLWQSGKKTSLFFETIGEIKTLKKEQEELKLKIRELLAENITLKELKKENEILRQALDIGLEKEFKFQLGQVIAKDPEDFLLINKGLEDGIKKGSPVITQEKILVGKIFEVYQNFSKVMLISNKKSSFDAKIVDSEIYGLIKGKGNLKIHFELLPQDQEIKEGEIVVTSAMGGIFPAGILVGEIEKIKKSDLQPFQEAEIRPAFDIKNLEFLFIIQK